MPHDPLNWPNPLNWIDDELSQLEANQLRRRLARRCSPQAARIVIDGRELINFGSNDYLGLAADQRLLDEAVLALRKGHGGSGASPLVTGRSELHAELERRLAEFERTRAALLFPTGYAANLGTIAALADRGDLILSDARNHASIVDGCRLSRAEVRVYPHADVQTVHDTLSSAGSYRRRLIVTDALFSMDGDLAPLAELVEVAQKFGAALMVDEAHSTGVFGNTGRGVSEYLDVADAVQVKVGTLSKALGSVGGFVAGSDALIQWLLNKARTYVFSTAAPGATCAVALAALRIVQEEPDRRSILLQRASRLREQLRGQGWHVGPSQSQIIPVIVGQPGRTMRMAEMLRDRGLLVPGIRPPSVPAGQSLLRISLGYGHTPAMIDQLVGALGELVSDQLGGC